MRSSKIFGNAKYAEIVLALGLDPEGKTAQDVARTLAVPYSLVRDVLVRLAEAGVLSRADRPHDRAPQLYAVADPAIWAHLLALATLITDTEPKA